MFGNETFIVRVAKDAVVSRGRAGDYVRADPDEPAGHGSLVAVRDPGHGGETVVRLLIEREGRWIRRARPPRPRTHRRRRQRSRQPERSGARGKRGLSATADPAPCASAKGPAWNRPPHRHGHPVRAMAGQSGGEVVRPRLHQYAPLLDRTTGVKPCSRMGHGRAYEASVILVDNVGLVSS